MSVESPNKTAHLWVFYCRNKKKGKQKRLPWQEAVFNVVDNLGRLSPTGRRFGPKNQGWTQPKLAETLHFAPSTVHYWLNGTHCPSVETLKKLCEILYIPIQDLLNDELDIPEYYEIDQYLPYPICCYPEDRQDSIHIIIDAGLAYEGILHRFKNCAGDECSAIYRAGKEVWWHYRENEAKMIRDWNEVHAND